MNEMIAFDKPTRVIVHFQQDQDIAERMGGRVVRYQVVMGDNLMSPTGDFIRFEHDAGEIHGWIKVEDIIIDEILEIQVEGEWKVAA